MEKVLNGKKIVLGFVLFLVHMHLFAQGTIISGKIVDHKSNPIPGASIHLLNTNH
jgi:hypothetical protein